MKNYIYYPNFEPPESEWLKFSLLYLDKFESIIPYNRRHLISDDYSLIYNETDLVDFFSPESQSEPATLKAIHETEKILKRTYESSFLFNRVNILRDWRNTDTWDYQIYGEKFSYSWGEFCESEKIGKINSEGILLPKSLAFLYMTHLAKEIAFERNGNIITDNLDYERYTSYYQIKSTKTNVRDSFIRGVIKLQVPMNINSIPFKTLIKFRNNNRDLITAFNSQIDIVENSIGNGISEQQFIDNYKYTYNEITREIIKLGIDVATIPLAFYALTQSVDALNQEYIKEILGSLSIIGGGYYGIRKSLYDKKDERMCKKYLARLNKIR
ncbi:hypothetical protein OZ666_07275 [Elizabethkingia sp. HX QKY]|uniref:hypothetical protein n=1 Tax=Elizabethkingia TaxID=308865 RepID=UPI002A245BF9|nr:hypothetical protein [Elizabethkingia sp. HX QKY]MDX8571476.1 hypothetical protein [Elizabethkingia sp. HX QKY]